MHGATAAPRVTVVMPVWNAGRHLREAVESVLAQTFGDLELRVEDDASDDGAVDALADLRDPRMVVARHAERRGATLRRRGGVEAARGALVALLDADDVCSPDRLARQVACLDAHPDVGVVGAWAERVDAEGRPLGEARTPVSEAAVRFASLFLCPFLHSTVVFRRDAFLRHGLAYDPRFETAEDYELWSRALAHVRGRNLPEVLVRYRVHPGSVSATRAEALARDHEEVSFRALVAALPGAGVTRQDAAGLRALLRDDPPPRAAAAARAAREASMLRLLDLQRAWEESHPSAPAADRAEVRRTAAGWLVEAMARPGAGPPPPGVVARVAALHPPALAHLAWGLAGRTTEAVRNPRG